MLVYDKDKCIGCGFCVDACPCLSIAQEEKGKTPHFIDGKDCILCGHCVSICPKGAVTHSRLPMDMFKEEEPAFDYEQIGNLLKTKRSIRHFKDEPISEDMLSKLIESVHFAPTDANSQDTGLIVMTDRTKIDALEAYIIKGFEMYVDYAVNTQKIPEDNLEVSRSKSIIHSYKQGKNPIFHNAPCVVFCYTHKMNGFGWYNAAVAMDYMSLDAHAAGLGSCVIGRAMYDTDAIAKFFSLDEDKKIYACMTLGHPKYKYRLSTPKKEVNVIRY